MQGDGEGVTVRMLPLASLRLDGGTQAREAIDMETVDDYARDMEAGEVFPAVIVFHDGAAYWLADGYHRTLAAQQARHVEIKAEVRRGTLDEARWFAAGANRRNGRRMTTADKRRAVEVALRVRYHESDRAIASHVNVDHKTVAACRARLARSGEIPQLDVRTGRDGKARTSPPERRGAPPEPPAVEPEPAIVTSPPSPPPSTLPPAAAPPPPRTRPRPPEPAEIADPAPRPMQLHLAAVLADGLAAPSRPTAYQRRIAAILRASPRRLAEAIEELQRWAARRTEPPAGGAP